MMAGYTVSLEPRGCFPLNDTLKRPDGMVRNYTSSNQYCIYDESITHRKVIVKVFVLCRNNSKCYFESLQAVAWLSI